MPEKFDPYYTWLGIPPAEQPADFYRLLGIKRFEDNREVISNAADQRMAHVRSFQTGPAARDSQRVLNDLSKAAGCLLNPRRKAMYDQHLQSSLVTASTEEARLPPSAGTAPTIQVRPGGKPKPTAPVGRHKLGTRVGIALAVIAILAVAAVASLINWSKSEIIAEENKSPLVVTPNTADTAKLGQPAAVIADPIAAAAAAVAAKVPNASAKTATTPPVDSGKQNSPEKTAVAAAPTSVESNQREPGSFAALATPSDPNPASSAKNSIPATPAASASPNTAPSAPAAVIPAGTPKVLHFDGQEWVELSKTRGLLDPAKPFTVELWVRFSSEERPHWLAGDMIVGPNHPDVPAGMFAGWQFFIQQTRDSRHRIGFSTRDGYASDFPVVPDGWHHLSASGDTRRITVHVNGRRSASGEVSTLLSSFNPAPIAIHIGAHPSLHANQPIGFKGDLAALRVSSTCRYTANFEPALHWEPDSDTQVLFDFVGSSGDKLIDLSGYGRDGVIHGAKWAAAPERLPVTSVASVPPVSAAPAPAAAPAPVVEAVRPIPDDAALVKARQQVRTVFESEFKQAKEPKDQLALADKLMALSAESTEDLPARFAMIEEAHKLAVQAGDLTKSLSMIDSFARHFEIDAAKLKAAAVNKCGDAAKTTADRRRAAEIAVGLLDELITSGKFDAAADVAQSAVSLAARAKETELGKVARDFRDEITQAKKHWNEAREAEKKLQQTPDDMALNLTWGRFVCFYQRNWNQGLPFLAKGSDQQLSAAAKQDMENAAKPEQQADVGRAWSEAIKSVEPAERPAVALRALHWLRLAESQLKGLAKADVERQVKDLETTLPARFKSPAKTNKANGPLFQPPPEFVGMPGRIQVNGADVGVMWKYEAGLKLGNANVVGVLAQANIQRGRLRMEFVGLINLAESTVVNVGHNGGSATGTATLMIDNKPVGEVGGMRATSDIYKVELNAGEHVIRWILQGDDLGTSSLVFTNAATAQPLALYHSPALVALMRDNPTRARLNVNMNRN